MLNDGNLSAINVFKRFELLSVRYRNAQTLEPLEPWDGQLSSDFTFLHEISFRHPVRLAELMTNEHLQLFSVLQDEDFPQSERLSDIIKIGMCLSKDVTECTLTDSSLVEKLAIFERVSY